VKGYLRVGIAQINPRLFDVAANLERHLALMDEARAQGVQLLVFPELSLTGYLLETAVPDTARRTDDGLVMTLARASQNMLTVFGLVEEGAGAQFYNTALAVLDGRVQFQHRKIYLPTYGNLAEGKYFAAGNRVDTFPLVANDEKWETGLLICADVWNPPLPHLAACRGATLLIVPVNSAVEAVGGDFDNPQSWDVVLRYLALTYSWPVVMVNRVGQEGNLRFWGGSRVVDPFGEVVVQMGEEEGLVTAVLDYDQVRQARFQLPTLRDTNLPLIMQEYRRLQNEEKDG
jgi:predicted amidohydrolase